VKHLWFVPLIVVAVIFFQRGTVSAQYNSSNYQTNEVQFGVGGDYNQSSSNYQGSASVGGLGVGQTSSSSYQAYSGFLTPNEPFLEFVVDTSLVDLGLLDSSSTKTATATFHVRSYLNSTYAVQTLGSPPTYASGAGQHVLNTLTSPSNSVIGTEQFGINLVANTSPATFGADPSKQPDSSFAKGIASTGYDTLNLYKYVSGDTIAESGNPGWGETNFTIAYIANSALLTPAGTYTMTQDLVVTTFY
jgi:hypothetical protein